MPPGHKGIVKMLKIKTLVYYGSHCVKLKQRPKRRLCESWRVEIVWKGENRNGALHAACFDIFFLKNALCIPHKWSKPFGTLLGLLLV